MAKSVYIADVCKEIFAGGDVPKSALSYEKTAEYNVPIFSNGEKNCGLYGYTNNARVKEPSITVSARGTIGYTAIRTEPFVPVVRLITLTPKSEVIDLDYLFYATQNYKFEGSGTSIPQLTVPMLKKYKFPLPEMSHQKAIAVKFEKLDQLISLRKQQLAKLDELVKARFVEMFGEILINSMGWVEAEIGAHCFVTKLAGFEYTQYIHYENSGEVVMVKAQNIKNGKLNDKDLSYISAEVSELLPRSQLMPGDIVMTYVGANIGDVAVIDNKYKYHLAPNVAKIRPDLSVYNSVFLMKLLMYMNPYIVKNSADTAKAALGMNRIRKLKAIVPPLSLQNEFAAFVERVDQQKQTVQQSLEKLELMKKALMQEYFG